MGGEGETGGGRTSLHHAEFANKINAALVDGCLASGTCYGSGSGGGVTHGGMSTSIILPMIPLRRRIGFFSLIGELASTFRPLESIPWSWFAWGSDPRSMLIICATRSQSMQGLSCAMPIEKHVDGRAWMKSIKMMLERDR